ncbi:MAG: ABC transporter permease [Candidatus Acidiferrales bacterium]
MSAIYQNLRYAARMLAKTPGFTLVAVLTLTLGIGANAAIFSVVYAALLKPQPYRQPDRLVTMGEGRIKGRGVDEVVTNNSLPDYKDWKASANSFESMAAYSYDAYTMTGNSEPKNVFVMRVSSDFFRTLGVNPALGRDFVDGEDATNGPKVAMLTYGFWQTDFGSDPSVIGHTIQMNGKSTTIVGVLPHDFQFAPSNGNPVWVPLNPQSDEATRRSLRWLRVVARLAPGVSMKLAQAEIDGITVRLAKEYPQFDGSVYVVMTSLKQTIVGKIQPLLFVLLGAVGFVLLIACANVANLMMTRAVGRRKEFAIRTALGATRGQLVSQLLTESMLLAVLGAAAGLVGAQWSVNALLAAIPESIMQTLPNLRTAATNLPILGFLAAIALLTAFLFGLAPGIAASQVGVSNALKDETRGGTSAGHARFRNALVVAELAISVVLLVGAGLMLESLSSLLRHDPGFDGSHLLVFSVNLPDDSYPSQKEYPNLNPSAIRLEHELSDKLRNAPGVTSVGVTDALPVGGASGTVRFVVEGQPVQAGEEDESEIIAANVGYFGTLKIPLVRGRTFAETDQEDTPGVLVVNQAFATKYFRDKNPIGKRIHFTFNAKEPYREIVGVTRDVAQDDLAGAPAPLIYFPMDQGASTYMTYLVRTEGTPEAFLNTAQALLHEIDPQLPVIQPETMEQFANQAPSVFLRRYPSYLIGSFAALAVILAMIGLYGLISFGVAQRTREIGIRVALGAQPADVLRMVLRQGIGATLAGIGVGIVAALALTRTIASMLYGVKPTDVATFVGVSAALMIVAVAACWVPARRAMRTDPLVALRHE